MHVYYYLSQLSTPNIFVLLISLLLLILNMDYSFDKGIINYRPGTVPGAEDRAMNEIKSLSSGALRLSTSDNSSS